jgi:hypothetical protein
MSSIPTWAVWAIVVPLVLLSPVLAFLLAIAAEIVIAPWSTSGLRRCWSWAFERERWFCFGRCG